MHSIILASKIRLPSSSNVGKVTKNTHLKLGTGNAWAGQSKAKLWFNSRKYVELFESDENEGAFAPTGSKRYKTQCYKDYKIITRMMEQANCVLDYNEVLTRIISNSILSRKKASNVGKSKKIIHT